MARKFVVAGHIAKDIHIKIDESDSLPKEFEKLFKVSTPISMIGNVLGKGWSFKKVLNVIERNAIKPISYSYGGRGLNIAYRASLRGALIELIGFFRGRLQPIPVLLQRRIQNAHSAGAKNDL